MSLEPNRSTEPDPLEIDVRSTSELLASEAEFLLLDCREPSEYELVNLPGAKLIPLGDFPARIEEIKSYRGQKIVVYCHHGMRSLQATHWLREQGLGDVMSMQGGIDAWATLIEPGMTRY